MRRIISLLSVAVGMLALSAQVHAGRERFETPMNGPNLGVWRITNDPAVRDHANYHNTQCWSPDGRYLCYTHFGYEVVRNGRRQVPTVHVYDLWKDEHLLIDDGEHPRWANGRNWLFYVHDNPRAGPAYEKGTEVRWLDLETGRRSRLCYGMERLGETDFKDRWLYGARRFRGQQPEFRIYRIPIQADSEPELLPEVTGSQLLPSPSYPVFFTRHDHRSEPFGATRYWFDLAGRNRRIFTPTLQQCHMGWLGNGEYLLLGNELIRGRRWNEPFPSNLHVLASVAVGDVSPCGRSGRYACGDSRVADLRSGDGWHFIDPLSVVCYPKEIADNSGIYDADPKGSPDGTKVCFVSNYDLKDAPLTFLGEDHSNKPERLLVESTEGFAESGHLVIGREVIRYESKTSNSFDGLGRSVYDTMPRDLRAGRAVTSFEARCITPEQWKRIGRSSLAMRRSISGAGSPLLKQRQTDVYVVVVRMPDRPYLRIVGGTVLLIPGEEHYETAGYHLLRDGKRITEQLLPPGSTFNLAQPGLYRAVAVEWSGLESDPSAAVRVMKPTRLQLSEDSPEEFSWTSGRWLIGEHRVSPVRAAQAPEAVREIVHRYDGVIHREWHRHGQLARRYDLNHDGRAIRRAQYENGRIAVREYWDAQGSLVSRELFDADGFITEWIRFGTRGRRQVEQDHWWYDEGTPIRQVRAGTEYVKHGDRFGIFREGRFIDTPRGARSRR